jgi:hypothetical protein
MRKHNLRPALFGVALIFFSLAGISASQAVIFQDRLSFSVVGANGWWDLCRYRFDGSSNSWVFEGCLNSPVFGNGGATAASLRDGTWYLHYLYDYTTGTWDDFYQHYDS